MNLLPGHMIYQADKVQVPRLRIHTLLILLCVAVTTDRSRPVNVELQPEGDDEPCIHPPLPELELSLVARRCPCLQFMFANGKVKLCMRLCNCCRALSS